MPDVEPMVRPGTRDDASRVAALHAGRITEGFLPTLGPAFLTRLYRRIVAAPEGIVLVADVDGEVVGFVAAATSLDRIYRSFLVRDGVLAALSAAPQIVRSWRRVLETLRYPASTEGLPEAEILAVAVDSSASGRGVGRELVGAALAGLERRGVPAVRVVAGADNAPAIGLYRRCGFETAARTAVHEGTPSEVLVWRSS
jgi:ribosomal protein S18 acetylase RimI-like enzyme